MNDRTLTLRVARTIVLLLSLTGSLLLLAGCSQDGQGNEDAATTDVPAAQEAPNQVLDPEAVVSGLPDTLALVNGEPVTRDELRRLLSDPLALGQLQSELGSSSPANEELKQAGLEMLIRRHLILEEAGRRNIRVPDNELDEAVTSLRQRFDDLESFGLWMQEQGVNEETLFGILKDEIIAERVQEVLVEDVRVGEDEVLEYYETHKEDLPIGEEVRLGIIIVDSSGEAEEIVAALKAGEDFADLARERSLGQRAQQGGDTGWVGFETLTPAMQMAIVGLGPGEAAGPLPTDVGEFLILGLEDRRPILAKSLEQARSEIEKRLLADKQQEFLEMWLEKQKDKSGIEILI